MQEWRSEGKEAGKARRCLCPTLRRRTVRFVLAQAGEGKAAWKARRHPCPVLRCPRAGQECWSTRNAAGEIRRDPCTALRHCRTVKQCGSERKARRHLCIAFRRPRTGKQCRSERKARRHLCTAFRRPRTGKRCGSEGKATGKAPRRPCLALHRPRAEQVELARVERHAGDAVGAPARRKTPSGRGTGGRRWRARGLRYFSRLRDRGRQWQPGRERQLNTAD